jgi:hypothetical protein
LFTNFWRETTEETLNWESLFVIMDSSSDIKLDLKRKRVTFIETDTQLLIECVQFHNSVIKQKNNKTNVIKTTTIKQITPLMKSKVS